MNMNIGFLQKKSIFDVFRPTILEKEFFIAYPRTNTSNMRTVPKNIERLSYFFTSYVEGM